MPRQARLDITGLLQHVIVRGIEQRDIFNDDADRQRFLDRFTKLLSETGVRCYAWALLSNHFHLLMMPTTSTLSSFMRRLLTGYAVEFNRLNRRSGHLFQNRYKSIVCEEETYLLELVRYIHLNPLRAGMVKSLEELDSYPFSGHAVLLGNSALAGQESQAVLERFGKKMLTARSAYHRFLADGIKSGRRDELVGGGMKRSQGERQLDEYESFDARILGSGEFVDTLKNEELLGERLKTAITLARLIEVVSVAMGLEPDTVRKPSKSRLPAAARGIICHLAIFELGYTGKEVGRVLHLGSSGVSIAARRGGKFLNDDKTLSEGITAKLAK
ncbi:MAG: transposase [Geobacteraceae bacterium]|nr:transposase [Geobacteraceae bacterium]